MPHSSKRLYYLARLAITRRSGPALTYFQRRIQSGQRPNDDPAGEGWSSLAQIRAVRGIALPEIPPGLPTFDHDRDTNPGVHTMIGPALPVRRPASVTATLVGLRARQ